MDNHIDKGIITKIYLENFVTYDKVVVKPGRNLNVIIGPNGTGKSTIVCAIVLGLGGKPATIGRAKHVADYVKTGCQQAKIEIQLTNGKRDDIVITRVFNTSDKSQWFLNGHVSNIKSIQDLTKSFTIQIDNLCQFLPQDKVQDFSKMNSQELLQNTERSVGDPVIFEYHKQLMESRVQHKTLEVEIKNSEKLLGSKVQVYENLKETVSSIKERKVIKKKIISLKQKKAWIIYDQMRKELLKFKTKKDEATAHMASLESEIKPMNDAIDKIRTEMKRLQDSVIKHNNEVNTKTVKLKNVMDKIIDCENKIGECENMCKRRCKTEEARDNEIELARQQKSKLDNDLALILEDVGSEETVLRQRQESISRMDKERHNINTLTNKFSEYKQEDERIGFKIRGQEEELHLLNIDSKRLQLLRERSIDAYRAVHWLRENQDNFSAKVHEPMFLSINVKDATYSKYLESVLPSRDLIAFVCENKQDMNLLLKYLRDDQKLQVNAVHSDPHKHVPMEPHIPLAHIKQFGFTNYLVSLIEAPATIMKYVVHMYNLNNIPVGTNKVEDNIDRIPNALQCYFSKKTMYAVRVSKYTGDKSTRMTPVSGTGMLSIVSDKSKAKEINEKLTDLREKKKSASGQIKDIEEMLRAQNAELDKFRAERNKFQQDLQQIQALKLRISMAEKKIVDLENERTSIEQIQESSSAEIKEILRKQLQLYKTYNSEMGGSFELVTANDQVKLELKLQNRYLRKKTGDSQDLRDQLRVAEDKLKQLAKEVQPLKNEVRTLYNEALQSTNDISPTDSAFEPINRVFNKLPPTVDEINNELNIAQAKVFCMGQTTDGENILREYDEVEVSIRKLRDSLERKSQELETTVQEIEKLKEKWLKPLTDIVEQINKNFSTYFTEMQCAGEVTLSHGENVMDFDQYGLKIRVKFREADQLQELTRHHQSGGERAVTTAIYMLSLQELSRVPFRCVDEINQGMDAENEKRVFNLLVKMTGRKHSSQYFLVTPKLVPDLEYSETVTVLCVFNGPFMISHETFDTEEYCRQLVAKRRRENDN